MGNWRTALATAANDRCPPLVTKSASGPLLPLTGKYRAAAQLPYSRHSRVKQKIWRLDGDGAGKGESNTRSEEQTSCKPMSQAAKFHNY